jgi:hypothetical protein
MYQSILYVFDYTCFILTSSVSYMVFHLTVGMPIDKSAVNLTSIPLNGTPSDEANATVQLAEGRQLTRFFWRRCSGSISANNRMLIDDNTQ